MRIRRLLTGALAATVTALATVVAGASPAVAWLGPRLASQGFVVIVFDTNSRYDQPSARGDQLLAALDYLTGSSSVRGSSTPTPGTRSSSALARR